jgi:hypothetical protein
MASAVSPLLFRLKIQTSAFGNPSRVSEPVMVPLMVPVWARASDAPPRSTAAARRTLLIRTLL